MRSDLWLFMDLELAFSELHYQKAKGLLVTVEKSQGRSLIGPACITCPALDQSLCSQGGRVMGKMVAPGPSTCRNGLGVVPSKGVLFPKRRRGAEQAEHNKAPSPCREIHSQSSVAG